VAGPLIAIRLHLLSRKTLGGCLLTGRQAGRAIADAAA
jgi:predicted oxidoreductase